MHARVTTFTIQTDKLDEAIKVSRDSVMPAAKKQNGFKGYYGLTDRATGKGMTITLWNTEADMLAGESGYYREALAKAAPLLAGSGTREHYEVTTHG